MIKNAFALMHGKFCKCTKNIRVPKFGQVKPGNKAISDKTLKKLLEANAKYSSSSQKEETNEERDARETKAKIQASKEKPKKVKDPGYEPSELFLGSNFVEPKLDFTALSKKAGIPKNARCCAGSCLDNNKIKSIYEKSKEIDQAAVALLKLINKECGSGIYESPRFCSEKLVKSLTTKSLTSLSRLKKEEMHRKRLLVVCDISGSCMDVCNELAATCYILIEYDDRIVIMFVSDDGPHSIIGDGVDDYVTAMLEQLNKFINDDEGFGASYNHWSYSEGQYPHIRNIFRDLINYLSIHAAIGMSDDQAKQTFRALTDNGVEFFYLANGNYLGYVEKLKVGSKEIKHIEKIYFPRWSKLPFFFRDGVSKIKDIIRVVGQYMEQATGKIIDED